MAAVLQMSFSNLFLEKRLLMKLPLQRWVCINWAKACYCWQHSDVRALSTGEPLSGARHDDVIKWKHFPRYWLFVRGIHRSPVNSPHKGQWRGAFIFSLICVWINRWVQSWGWWFETKLKPRSREITFVHSIRFGHSIVSKFCTEHDNDIPEFYTRHEDDWVTISYGQARFREVWV